MKAAIGLLSDAVPLFGFHKRSYIVMLSIVGSISLGLLWWMKLTSAMIFLGAMLLLLFQLQVASVDLLTEGKYAELMVEQPETGSDLVSFAWGLQSAGALFGSLISAVVLKFSPDAKGMFLVSLPLAAQVIIPAVRGWFPERRLPSGQRGIRYDKINQFPDMFKLAVFMTLGAILVGGSAIFSPQIQNNVSLLVALVLALLAFKWLPETLRKANLYLFLNNMLYLNIQGAMDYWMTAGPECVKDGPNFGMAFYVSYANLIGSLASVLGVVLFQVQFSKGTFRTAFLAAGIVKVAASVFDFIIIKRFNKRIGIPDEIFFMLGDAVIFQVINRCELMPSIVLTSKVCPPGMEASVYALLVSYQNLGIAVSRTVGDYLVDQLGIKTTPQVSTGQCDFGNLGLAVLIAHVAIPSLIFPLIFMLIPDARMTDDLVKSEEEGGASTGNQSAEEHTSDGNDDNLTDERVRLATSAELDDGLDDTPQREDVQSKHPVPTDGETIEPVAPTISLDTESEDLTSTNKGTS